MNRKASLTRTVVIGLALWWAGGIAPVGAAPKAGALFKQGRQAEARKEYDQALKLYEEALKQEPENQIYMMASRRLRFVAGQWHVDQGNKLLDKGRLLEAAAEFERAAAIDPASSIAEQQLRRTMELIARRQQQKAPAGGPAKPPEESQPEAGLSPIQAAKKETEEMLEAAQSIPRLKPISSERLPNLKVSNQSKVVFETIGKLAGINVLFDPEYQDRRVTLELSQATLYEALDYSATLAKAYWKPISSNAIFVTNDNSTKRRDYEELVVKTFYLTNAYTAQELNEIGTTVRTLADIRRVFNVTALNALVVRGTADQVALAEKVINDVDKSRAEVIIDVLVLEASRSRTRELGITLLSGEPGINIPVGFTPRNPVLVGGTRSATGTDNGVTPATGGTVATGSSAISLARIGEVSTNDFSLTLPGASIKALLSTSDTRVLQSPRVRGFDGYKASLRIGDRIPIATGSFQPGIGGVGFNPLVNTQFTYQDVGVNVDLTPRVHGGKEISLHIEVEISNVRDFVNIGGISQPVIGQRKIVHDIRLKAGEANVIGGLMQTQTSRTTSGVPVLGQIPLLGRLFSNERLDKSENEILIVLVPHVVRAPELTEVNMRGVAAGTDQTVKVSFKQASNGLPALPPAPPTPPAGPAPVVPSAVPPVRPPGPPGPSATGVPSPTPGGQSLAPTPPLPAAEPVAATAGPASSGAENLVPRLRFDRPQASEAVGARIILNLLADHVSELFASPLRVRFDPAVLRLVDARRGALLSSDGQDVIFSKSVEGEAGEASINLSRFPGAGGVSGSGVLLTLEFEIAAPGKTSVRIANVAARNARLDTIPLGEVQAEVVGR